VGTNVGMGEMESKLKKHYESPQVTKVSLRPEEAVLGACKIMGSAGPVGHSCNATQCRTQGS
jgi:hypothetical protein